MSKDDEIYAICYINKSISKISKLQKIRIHRNRQVDLMCSEVGLS